MEEYPKVFIALRQIDEHGISGTGHVIDGVIFHTGQVVICWRNGNGGKGVEYSSIAIYPSWEAFEHVHIAPHPPGSITVLFQDVIPSSTHS